MRIIIDRFEGNFAVVELENRTMVNMPLELLPAEAKLCTVIGSIHFALAKRIT